MSDAKLYASVGVEEEHLRLTRERSRSQTLADNTQDHGQLVDDELCAAVVVCGIPHVA